MGWHTEIPVNWDEKELNGPPIWYGTKEHIT